MEMRKLQKMLCTDAVKRGKLHHERCVHCVQPCGYGKYLLEIMGLKHIPKTNTRSLTEQIMQKEELRNLRTRINGHGGWSNDG